MISTKAFWKKFHSDHGGDPVVNGEWLLYADGAHRENSVMGAAIEPPKDPFKLAQLKVLYHRLRLKRAVADFNFRFNQVRETTIALKRDGRLPPTECLSDLSALREVVKERQTVLESAQEHLESVTPTERRERVEEIAKNKEACDSFLEKLNEYKV